MSLLYVMHRLMISFEKIYIEISNICNLQCTFCPVVERDKKTMNAAFFEKVIREVAPYTNTITLHVMGEPLAHPDLERLFRLIEKTNLKFILTTNAILLKRYQDQLLQLKNLKQINFSTHSFSDNFPDRDIQPYLQDLVNFSKRAHAERPDLYINYRLWNLRQDQQTKSTNQSILKTLNQEFTSFVQDNVDVGFKKSYHLTGRIYVHFDSQFQWPSPKDPVRSSIGTCHGTISHLAIHAEGKVTPCCLDKEAVITLGDLSVQTMTEILSSPRFLAMRQGFQEGRLVEDLCQRCTFIKRFDKKAQKLRAHSLQLQAKKSRETLQA
jgi:sulfatase maturation enzyme AslB (radical SAM superfamily)